MNFYRIFYIQGGRILTLKLFFHKRIHLLVRLFILEQIFYRILHELCFRDFIFFHPNDFFWVSIYPYLWSSLKAYYVILNCRIVLNRADHVVHKWTKSSNAKHFSREDALSTSKTHLIWAKLDNRDYSLVFIICFIIVHDFGKRPRRAYSSFKEFSFPIYFLSRLT